MKLTKQKLEKLIMEEYVRRIGDEYKPTNYPEYADKLTTLAKDDYNQARELADAIDEPLNIELGSGDFMEFMPHGIEQFKQVSPVTIAARNLGTLLDQGKVEVYFDTYHYKWIVAYYKEQPDGSYRYVERHSQVYNKYEFEKAIQHYNALADKKFVRSEPLKKRGEDFNI